MSERRISTCLLSMGLLILRYISFFMVVVRLFWYFGSNFMYNFKASKYLYMIFSFMTSL